MAGALSDRFGRKRLLIFSAALFVVTSLGNALAPSFAIFVAWRMLGGVAIGLASNLSPMYIAEIAPAAAARPAGRDQPAHHRHRHPGGPVHQLVRSSATCPPAPRDEFIRTSWYGQAGWRWMFALTAVPSLLFFVGMFFVPESPRWLVKNGSERPGPRRARADRRRRPTPTPSVRDIEATLASRGDPARALRATCSSRSMRRVLVLGVVLAVFQQWCGINVIFNYAEEIFQAAGYDISDVLKNIAWTGSVNLAFTFVALGVVDRGGRRPLMLLGAAGLAVIYIAMGLCYSRRGQGTAHAAAGAGRHRLLRDVAGPGDLGGDLGDLPQPHSRRGHVGGGDGLWIACFILTYTFPLLNAKLGSAGTFWLYAAICVAGLRLHPAQAAGDQGQDAGRDRTTVSRESRVMEV